MTTTTAEPRTDPIDSSLGSRKRAVARLVQLLGDEDSAVLEKAALALFEIGPYAAGPLAAALPRASTPRHKLVILGFLLTFGAQARLPVLKALVAAIKRERDPAVRMAAQAALAKLTLADLSGSSRAPGRGGGMI